MLFKVEQNYHILLSNMDTQIEKGKTYNSNDYKQKNLKNQIEYIVEKNPSIFTIIPEKIETIEIPIKENEIVKIQQQVLKEKTIETIVKSEELNPAIIPPQDISSINSETFENFKKQELVDLVIKKDAIIIEEEIKKINKLTKKELVQKLIS